MFNKFKTAEHTVFIGT